MSLFWSLDARLRKRRLTLRTLLGSTAAVSEDLRMGSTHLYYASTRRSSSRTPKRCDIVFPPVEMGTVVQRPTSTLANAVNSLIQQIDSDSEALGVEYGILLDLSGRAVNIGGFEVPQVPPSRPEDNPRWSGFVAGVRLSADSPSCTIWANFGMLDLIKHDCSTGKEIDRSDIRHYDALETANAGRIGFVRRTCGFGLLRGRLQNLRELTLHTEDENVQIMAVPQGKLRQQMEGVFRCTLEEMGMWPEPPE